MVSSQKLLHCRGLEKHSRIGVFTADAGLATQDGRCEKPSSPRTNPWSASSRDALPRLICRTPRRPLGLRSPVSEFDKKFFVIGVDLGGQSPEVADAFGGTQGACDDHRTSGNRPDRHDQRSDACPPSAPPPSSPPSPRRRTRSSPSLAELARGVAGRGRLHPVQPEPRAWRSRTSSSRSRSGSPPRRSSST